MVAHSTQQMARSADLSTAEVSTILRDIERICCAVPPWGINTVFDPAAVIAAPLLERIVTAVQAEGGALLLASVPNKAPAWVPPGTLAHSAIERILALLRVQPNDITANPSTAGSWLCFSLPLPGTETPGPASQSTLATHALLALRWPRQERQHTAIDHARALLPSLAEAICSAIGIILLQEQVARLASSERAHVALLREADAMRADWQQAFDAISDPVSIIDADYHVIRSNAAYRAMFGAEAMPDSRHQCFSQYEGQSTPCAGCPLPRTLATGRPGFVQRERLVPGEAGEQGERRVFQTWTYPARNHAGEIDHAVEIIKDVTDQEQLREVLNRAEALRQADRLKAELLGTVSHELRSPLAAIRGYAETLRRHGRRISRDERQDFLLAIVQASDRLQVVIDRVLELSELATGTLPHHLIPLDILPVIDEAVATCARKAHQADSRQWDFRVIAGEVEDGNARAVPLIRADPRLLSDVLDNLLENAVHYSPEGGQITITVWPRQADDQQATQSGPPERVDVENPPALAVPSLEIAVRDSGVGIPPEHLGRIFERFHRVDTRLTREVDGLGVGLAICKQIVDLHAGAIWAESEPGAGSTFHVLLPLAEGEMPPDRPGFPTDPTDPTDVEGR